MYLISLDEKLRDSFAELKSINLVTLICFFVKKKYEN